LRADIARYFPRWDLDDFHRNETGDGSMSWSRLWDFIEALPYDSMTRSALAGDRTRRRWTEMHYMQASALSYMQFMTQVMWAGQGLNGKPPKFMPWSLPDLRTPEQIAEDEAHAQRAAKFLASVRPPAPDPEIERRLREAVERRRAAEQAV
jgi:hypothetical protein